MCILEKEVIKVWIASDIVQIRQITDEDSFELRAVAAAVARLAGLAKYTVRVDEIGDGGVCDQCCLVDVSSVPCDFVQVGQSAENDPLVIRPGWLAVVDATIEAIIDETLAVNHP